MIAAALAALAVAAPPPQTPVIVAGQPIAAAAMNKLGDHPVDSRRDQPIYRAGLPARVRGADEATEAAWMAGEARRLHVTADPADVDRALAAEQHEWEDWAAALPPETPDEARARLARGVLEAAVGRALAARAHTTAGFAKVFDAFHRRWRARTSCRNLWRDPPMDRCANFKVREACVWMGAADVCASERPRFWFIAYDLSGALHPGKPDLDAFDADHALSRLRAALPRGVRRRLNFEAEADEQLLDGRRRLDVIAAARAILELQRSAAGHAIR